MIFLFSFLFKKKSFENMFFPKPIPQNSQNNKNSPHTKSNMQDSSMLNNSNSMNMISCSQFIMFKTQIYFLLQSAKGSKQLSLLDPIVGYDLNINMCFDMQDSHFLQNIVTKSNKIVYLLVQFDLTILVAKFLGLYFEV